MVNFPHIGQFPELISSTASLKPASLRIFGFIVPLFCYGFVSYYTPTPYTLYTRLSTPVIVSFLHLLNPFEFVSYFSTPTYKPLHPPSTSISHPHCAHFFISLYILSLKKFFMKEALNWRSPLYGEALP